MAQVLQKNIRVDTEQWNRIEEADGEHDVSPNQLVIELAIDALDWREWPKTEAEVKVAGPRCSPPRSSNETSSPTAASGRSRRSVNSSRGSCRTYATNAGAILMNKHNFVPIHGSSSAFDHPIVLAQLPRNALTRNRAGTAEAAARRLLSIIPYELPEAIGLDFSRSVFILEEGFAAANPVLSREA